MERRKTLDEIALSYKTDKASKYHNYTPVYEHYFESIRNKPLVLLELGIGDINSLNREGESILMWREYFPYATCCAIDNDNEKVMRNIDAFLCDQNDEKELKHIISQIGNPDIIIDDASHVQLYTIKSFEFLFPLLKSGGLYCIEDLQTAYFPSWGGDETIFDFNKETVMNYFFKVCHYVNLKKQNTFQIPPNINIPEIFTKIKSVHFYHGQIIIIKQ